MFKFLYKNRLRRPSALPVGLTALPIVADYVRNTREGIILTRVCQFVHGVSIPTCTRTGSGKEGPRLPGRIGPKGGYLARKTSVTSGFHPRWKPNQKIVCVFPPYMNNLVTSTFAPGFSPLYNCVMAFNIVHMLIILHLHLHPLYTCVMTFNIGSYVVRNDIAQL